MFHIYHTAGKEPEKIIEYHYHNECLHDVYSIKYDYNEKNLAAVKKKFDTGSLFMSDGHSMSIDGWDKAKGFDEYNYVAYRVTTSKPGDEINYTA